MFGKSYESVHSFVSFLSRNFLGLREVFLIFILFIISLLSQYMFDYFVTIRRERKRKRERGRGERGQVRPKVPLFWY